MSDAIKIMIVDDTITYRMILQKVVDSIPGTKVVGTAANGKLALGKLTGELPDVILLDVEMPEMDGLTTLQHLKARFPQVTVVMVSGLSRSNANIVMECLNAGALDFVTKPQESTANLARDALRRDLEPILSLIVRRSQPTPAPVLRRLPSSPVTPTVMPTPALVPPAPAPPRIAPAHGRPRKPDLVLIGSSTGGPAALTKVLSDIKQSLPVPMLIVQHMPPVFTASLAAQLARSSGMDVREAADGLELVPGRVILAMGGRHMTLTIQGNQKTMRLNDGPKVNECRPAVDVLFMSVAAAFQGSILSVILTGMGRDGANGVDALKRLGNTYCISQEKDSCVVYGMPRAVDEAGLADESLPLNQIGARILGLCKSH